MTTFLHFYSPVPQHQTKPKAMWVLLLLCIAALGLFADLAHAQPFSPEERAALRQEMHEKRKQRRAGRNAATPTTAPEAKKSHRLPPHERQALRRQMHEQRGDKAHPRITKGNTP